MKIPRIEIPQIKIKEIYIPKTRNMGTISNNFRYY
tara:strand:- start:3375 stop:3479 length:105 start_codon:yes stop_codon:yes gene_type:complete